MKLTAFFFFVSFGCIAQTDQYHFFNNDHIWRVDASGYWQDCYEQYYYHYLIDGDTIIGNEAYRKVYRSSVLFQSEIGGAYEYDTPPCNFYPWTTFKGYVGAIREDSLAEKCYAIFHQNYDSNDSMEVVLYDYSLDENNSSVSSVDSVQILGAYRKRWNMADGSYIIQGIGSSKGFVEPHLYTGTSRLICVQNSVQNLTVYDAAFSNMGCQQITSADQIDEKIDNVKLFPNPSSDFIQVNGLPENEIFRYTIVNIFGSVCQEGILPEKLAVQNLSSGVYFLNISNPKLDHFIRFVKP